MIILQCLAVLIIAFAWGFMGFASMTSALLGGVASIVPSLYFAWRFFASGKASEPHKIVAAFYRSELVKLLLSVVLVLGILSMVRVQMPAFLTGFIGANMGMWFAPLLMMNKKRWANE